MLFKVLYFANVASSGTEQMSLKIKKKARTVERAKVMSPLPGRQIFKWMGNITSWMQLCTDLFYTFYMPHLSCNITHSHQCTHFTQTYSSSLCIRCIYAVISHMPIYTFHTNIFEHCIYTWVHIYIPCISCLLEMTLHIYIQTYSHFSTLIHISIFTFTCIYKGIPTYLHMSAIDLATGHGRVLDLNRSD